MKYLIKSLFAFMGWALFLYGIFAFSEWDYNPLYWSPDARFFWALTVGFSALMGLVIGLGMFAEIQIAKEKK